MNKLYVHLWSLPRWFAAPAVVPAVALGAVMAGAPFAPTVLVCLSALALMASGHSLNTFTDWVTGVDKEGGSVEKSYTDGSQVIRHGGATPAEVFLNAFIWFLIALALLLLAASAGSNAVFAGFILGALLGYSYSPVLKYLGLPELLGIGGFGIASVMMGYAASGALDLFRVVVAGFAISVPFAVSWGVDQLYDAKSDVKRGVHNIGGLLLTTGLPVSTYITLGVAVTYIALMYAILTGALSRSTFMAILAMPLFVICIAGVHSPETREKGVRYGLAGIFTYEVLVLAGQAIG